MELCVRLCRNLEAYRSEIAYVFDVIGDRLGVQFRLLDMQSDEIAQISYGDSVATAKVRIDEVLFSKCIECGSGGLSLRADWKAQSHGETKVETFGLILTPVFLADGKSANDAVASPNAGGGDSWRISYDIVGFIFFMLSRIEELDRSDLDSRGRFRAERTLAGQLGFLRRPEVEYHIALLGKILRAAGLIDHPEVEPRIQIHLTHDVDRLRSYHTYYEAFHDAAGDIYRRRSSPGRAILILFEKLTDGEPGRSFSYLMDQAEAHGLQCSFFFQSGSLHSMDAPYWKRFSRDMKLVCENVRGRNHRIGFHPGFASFDNPDVWKKQKECLEGILEETVDIGRQHVLRFHPSTWRIWNENGMVADYTLAFPEGIAFRSGTTHGYPVFGLRDRRRYRLITYPTLIMDFSLFMKKYVDLSDEEAFDAITAALGEVSTFGGDIVTLFHPVTVMTMTRQYERCLDMISAVRTG